MSSPVQRSSQTPCGTMRAFSVGERCRLSDLLRRICYTGRTCVTGYTGRTCCTRRTCHTCLTARTGDTRTTWRTRYTGATGLTY